MIATATPPGTGRRPGKTSRLGTLLRHGDRPFGAAQVIASAIALAIIVLVGWVLLDSSQLSIQAFGLGFITGTEWDPAITLVFGALPYIVGTLVTASVSLVIAVPIGIGTAIFLAELSPGWLRRPLGLLIELLAAIPSVVYGLWGLFVLIPVLVTPLSHVLESVAGFLPIFAGPIYGPSRLAASVLLAAMVLPTITAISRDVFLAVPVAQREGALALGATRWETVRQVLIPYGTSGFLGAIILGLARALGETIAVTMVIGNNLDLTASLLHPGYTMASIIANEFSEATFPLYQSALIEIGLLLFVMTLLINAVARILIMRVASRSGGPSQR